VQHLVRNLALVTDMPWIATKDRLPPFETKVFVAGDYTPVDDTGHPLYGFPIASRRNYPGVPWFWSSIGAARLESGGGMKTATMS